MMGFIKKVLLALSVAVVAYYVYNPLPANIEQPVLYSTLSTIFRITEDLGKVPEMLGYKELLVFRREALDLKRAILLYLVDKPTDINITDTTFNGVQVRIYRDYTEDTGKLQAGFVYVHGGGYVLASVDFCDSYLMCIVRETGVTVVSIEYRLAPENPSPAALGDCEAATQYFFANAQSFGVDAKRIGVGGDSAGGNMAAVLSLRNRDRADGTQFAYQVLIYPWVQAVDFKLPSYIENDIYTPPYMKRFGMALYTLAYLGIDRNNAEKLTKNQHISKSTLVQYQNFLDMHKMDEDLKQATGNQYKLQHTLESPEPLDMDLAESMKPLITDPDNFPLMAESVANVPPALVMTVGLDPLRDEGLLYLQRLRLVGVETEHYHDDICWHGAISLSDGPLKFECGDRMVLSMVKYIAQYSNRTG